MFSFLSKSPRSSSSSSSSKRSEDLANPSNKLQYVTILARAPRSLLVLASSDEYEEDEEDEGSSQVSSAEYESKEETFARLRKALLKAEKRERGSSTKYDESGATTFLLEKMTAMGMEAFNVDETIKTAISAFQHLFQKEFKANEIEVTVMGPRYFGPLDEAVYIDTYVKKLEMSEIKYHLDTINGLRSWCNGFFLIQRLLGWRPSSF